MADETAERTSTGEADVVSDERRGLLRLTGEWTIATAERLEQRLVQALPSGAVGECVIDGEGITRLDTAGAWLIEATRRRYVAGDTRVVLQGFDSQAETLLKTVSNLLKEPLPRVRAEPVLKRFIVAVGRQAVDLGRDLVAITSLFGEFCATLVQIVLRRQSMRWPALFTQIDRVGLKAIPIIALMSFLIGMIIAQQGGFYLRTFGAEVYVIALVGVLVCREIGVLLTSIMVAGRSGSAMTAEIGSMKMREEIDALTVLGVSPTGVLVVPRLAALILTLPLLTLVSDLAALAGAWVVVVTYIGLPSDTFFQLLREAVTIDYVLIGLCKAPVMAATIGLVACAEGMKVAGSAESLGLHTTISVVKGIFAVIVMDGIFAIVLASLEI
ncbi:ABC transporter permease [Methylobrevis pamukkalensis]|uniref:Putative phospholipid ABC transporter permease protein MlaE n=1 Tax=Methylobrevis pamukkalensis TaxID=1439726 RepID=A0A1E3H574_9HYPH|nr:ABC transporter permease [Methylobrevis pamukkalensis]ODN71462.1 putative phospholipid ABC transporter permease protein MlaE [Methylobrevis pamukkalensis]